MNRPSGLSNVILGLIVSLLGLLVLQSFMTVASTQTVLLGVIAGLMAVLALQPTRVSAKSFQYKLVPPGSLSQQLLDELGVEGWRLVCADQAGSGYIFRR